MHTNASMAINHIHYVAVHMKRFKMNLTGNLSLPLRGRLRLDILLSDKTFALRIKSKSPPEFAV